MPCHHVLALNSTSFFLAAAATAAADEYAISDNTNQESEKRSFAQDVAHWFIPLCRHVSPLALSHSIASIPRNKTHVAFYFLI